MAGITPQSPSVSRAAWAARRALRGGGGLGLHHAHLLFVFLKQQGAPLLAHFLLPRNTRSHFLGEIQRGAHLAFATEPAAWRSCCIDCPISPPIIPCNSVMELFIMPRQPFVSERPMATLVFTVSNSRWNF